TVPAMRSWRARRLRLVIGFANSEARDEFARSAAVAANQIDAVEETENNSGYEVNRIEEAIVLASPKGQARERKEYGEVKPQCSEASPKACIEHLTNTPFQTA